MKHGFVRVAAVAPALKVADVDYNVGVILENLKKLTEEKVQIALFPELCLSGYSCGDLFFQQDLLNKVGEGLKRIASATRIPTIVGAPLIFSGRLYNCAVVINDSRVVGVIPKTYLPNRNEFYEERWFCSGANADTSEYFGTDILFNAGDFAFGIEVCEDLFAPIPPSSYQAIDGARIIFNLSASNALVAKKEYRRELVKQQSARTLTGYVYASAGPGESTTDVVYSGHLMVCENGSVIAESDKMTLDTNYIITEIDVDKLNNERIKNSSFAKSEAGKKFRSIAIEIPGSKFDTLTRKINKFPFVPADIKDRDIRCKEILEIQSMGLAKRLAHTGIKNVLLGISGGLDSTLALIVCNETFKTLGLDTKGIKTVTMPGPGTSKDTEKNATKLAEGFKTDFIRIPINTAVKNHLKDIGHEEGVFDITFENAQARERTQILFDLANQFNGLVVGTGNLSEMALGWATYNGDQMSNYSVNCGVPKTLVKYLVKWYAEQSEEPLKGILENIYNTPISPELLPLDKEGGIAQKTENKIGPYELHDFFLYNFIRGGFSKEKVKFLCGITFEEYTQEDIDKWFDVFIKRFFQNQFKRSAVPDGPKVGSVCLSPRGDWRMPSDAVAF